MQEDELGVSRCKSASMAMLALKARKVPVK